MEEIKEKIIITLKLWNENYPYKHDKACWNGYKMLEKETGIDIGKLKKAMKCLKNDGKVKKLHTSSDVSRVAGSGWFLV